MTFVSKEFLSTTCVRGVNPIENLRNIKNYSNIIYTYYFETFILNITFIESCVWWGKAGAKETYHFSLFLVNGTFVGR